jgi:hypothetical protein
MASASKSTPPAGAPAVTGSATAGGTDLLGAVRELVTAYQESVQRAQFAANSRHLQISLAYAQGVQEAAKRAAGLTTEPAQELKSSLNQQDPSRYSAASHQYWSSVLEAHTSSQKDFERAAGEYYGGFRDVWGELKGGVDDANTTLARGLKDALVKADVSAADLPVLLAICNAVSWLSRA